MRFLDHLRCVSLKEPYKTEGPICFDVSSFPYPGLEATAICHPAAQIGLFRPELEVVQVGTQTNIFL